MSSTLLTLILPLLSSIGFYAVSLQPAKTNRCQLPNQPTPSNYRVTNPVVADRIPNVQASEEIASQVTVRIIAEGGGGSGVIVGRHGQTYTVLTNEHVVANSRAKDYKILTVDGTIHSGIWEQGFRFGEADLAIVQFSSKSNYQVVVLGNSNALSLGDRLYAAGFPNYYFPKNSNTVESTHNWGLRAFRLTVGAVGMLPSQSLREGYGLGYTNEISDGMSGGPVLNQRGELVGINGKLKYSLQGVGGYLFIDGTRPSQQLFEQMQSLSWAIPISNFRQLLSLR